MKRVELTEYETTELLLAIAEQKGNDLRPRARAALNRVEAKLRGDD